MDETTATTESSLESALAEKWKAKYSAAVAVLKDVQWAARDTAGDSYCPSCQRYREGGHAMTCPLYRAMGAVDELTHDSDAAACDAVHQQLLGTKYAGLAARGHQFLARAVELLRADHDALVRALDAVPETKVCACCRNKVPVYSQRCPMCGNDWTLQQST